MADNTSITEGTGTKVASDEVTYSGDTAKVQLVRLVDVTGAEGSKTVTTYTVPVTGTFWQATQPVSGTVSVSGSVAVTGTFWQATQPVSGTVAATQSGTWNVTNISGTVSLPTGAATSANQTTLNTAIGSSSDAVLTTGNAGSHSSYLRTIMEQTLSTAAASVKIDQTTPGTTDAVTVKTPADVITFTPTLDTSAYASGDVLFATASLGTVTRANDGRAVLMSLTGIDKSKNKPAMTLLFYQTNVTSAAANAANALSDADQANLLGYVRILAADWIDYANNSIVCKTAINLLLEAVSGAQNVYVVGILDAGTPTFAASDLVFKLGVVQS